MPKFLHTADWQVGRQFTNLDGEDAAFLAEARLTVVERLANLASVHRVDAVLVAGDVFDLQTASDRTIRRLFNALAGYAGPWLLLPGNHDAALAEGVWAHAQRIHAVPPNAHLLLSPQVRIFEQEGFAVLPAPLVQRHTYGDLTAWFDSAETPTGLVRIGLAHGSVSGILPDNIDSPNPIAPDRAERARLDYLALGDWHGCMLVNARTAYSGTPEPDRFKANESGQALLVDVPAAGSEPTIARLPTAQYHWKTMAAQLHVASDVDALVDQLSALEPHHVVELHVAGQVDMGGYRLVTEAIARAAAQARHLQANIDQLEFAPTDADIASLNADGYIGEVIAELRSPPSDCTTETAREALAILTTMLMQRTSTPASTTESV